MTSANYGVITISETRNREDQYMRLLIRTLRPEALKERMMIQKEVMIMLAPSIFGENLFDDWFDFPDFRDFDKA